MILYRVQHIVNNDPGIYIGIQNVWKKQLIIIIKNQLKICGLHNLSKIYIVDNMIKVL